MPANLENSAVATGLEKVSFHYNPKEGNARECSNYFTIALISHAIWRRKWQPTPVFLPGESCGQGSLVGYGPWGLKELDRT